MEGLYGASSVTRVLRDILLGEKTKALKGLHRNFSMSRDSIGRHQPKQHLEIGEGGGFVIWYPETHFPGAFLSRAALSVLWPRSTCSFWKAGSFSGVRELKIRTSKECCVLGPCCWTLERQFSESWATFQSGVFCSVKLSLFFF